MRPVMVVLPVAVLAAGFLVFVWFGQRSVLLPIPRIPTEQFRGQAEVIQLETSSGIVEALFLEPDPGAPTPAPLLVFTHGNGELADFWIDQFAPPRSWGWAV